MSPVTGKSKNIQHVKAKDPNKRRVVLTTRVRPETMEYLESLVQNTKGLGCETHGRAVDLLVRVIQHPGIIEQLRRTGKFSAINLLG